MRIFVHRNDYLRALHPDQVLDGARNSNSHIEGRRHRTARLADLVRGGYPSFFNGAPRRTYCPIHQLGDLFDQRKVFRLAQPAPSRDNDIGALKKDSAIFDDVNQWPYDVIVMYNMTQQITGKQRENFLKLLDQGVGLVALHHCVGAYQDWDEYPKIIGCRYYIRPTIVDGQTIASRFAEGVSIAVHVADAAENPVTAGLKDFVVRDEVYSNCRFEPDNTYLLTTDHEKSDKKLAWVRTYRKSNVCCILLGHGTSIFSDSAYQRLVHNAILWAAKRPGL